LRLAVPAAPMAKAAIRRWPRANSRRAAGLVYTLAGNPA
jgi:hypothetical protein